MEPQIENRLPEVKVESLKAREAGFESLKNPDKSLDQEKNLNQEKTFEEAVFASEQLKNEAEGAMKIAQPLPPLHDENVSNQDDGVSVIAAPQVAQDGDLMEQEWVDKLKKMVKETRDPYLKQKYFRDIQMDYLKKRYGRIIGGGK